MFRETAMCFDLGRICCYPKLCRVEKLLLMFFLQKLLLILYIILSQLKSNQNLKLLNQK